MKLIEPNIEDKLTEYFDNKMIGTLSLASFPPFWTVEHYLSGDLEIQSYRTHFVDGRYNVGSKRIENRRTTKETIYKCIYLLRIILYLGRIFLYFYNTADSRLYFVLLVHHLVHLVDRVDLVILHWNSFTGQQ